MLRVLECSPGVEILLATSVNFAIVFVFWRPVAGLLHTVKVPVHGGSAEPLMNLSSSRKARVWHDVLALALASVAQ